MKTTKYIIDTQFAISAICSHYCGCINTINESIALTFMIVKMVTMMPRGG